MKVLNRIYSEVFIEGEGIKIYKVKSRSELLGLMNKMPLRVLFGNSTYVWNATLADHKKIKNVLKEYEDLDSYEGFLIENKHLIPSLQITSGKINLFLNKYFPSCKKEKDLEGIIL